MTAPWRERAAFRLGEVEVRPASNELATGGRVTRVKPRLMDVLLRLAAAPGEVVTRETLLADAWPRRMVNDEVLSRVVADLRNALGDDARDARYIETLPKVGYRLVAPIAPLAKAAPPSASRWPRWAVAAAVLIALVAIAIVWPAGRSFDAGGLTRQLAAAEPFASDVALELAPRFSPDGKRVAFARTDDGRAQIVVRDAGTASQVTIGDPAELNLSPVFFPDGKRIAFYRRPASGDCEIVAHDLATGAQTRLVDCAHRPQPRFDISPDGATIVFTAVMRPDFPAGLVARDIATGNERIVTSPEPDAGHDLYPRYSPDGKRIAFFRGTQSHYAVWLVEADGSAHAAGSPRGLSYGAAWLAPRGPLLVAADWFGQRSLNVLDLETRTAAAVGARGARFPDIGRSGDIVFENAIYNANLFLIDRKASPPRELWPSTRYTNQAEFSPDGTHMLFVSNRDGAGSIYVAALDGAARRIPLPDDYVYLRPHWSYNGRYVYALRASRREDGSRAQQAIRIEVATGSTEVLTALGDNVFDLRDSADGSYIVGELAGNAARLMRTEKLDAVPQRLPLPLASEYQVAGGRVALMQPNLAGLTLCDLKTLGCEALALPLDERNRFDWLLTARALWYRTAAPPYELVRYDLAQRTADWTSEFAPTALGLSIAVSPDESRIVVAREAPPAIDLMLARKR